MTPLNIKTHLIDRFLNGYTLNDLRYSQILEYLFEVIKKEPELTSLEDLIQNYLGRYNVITADTYHTLAIRYLTSKKKTPNVNDIFQLV